MSTRAIKFLKQHRIDHEVVKYDHREKGALFAADAVGFPLERTVKTLVADLGERSYCLALMPGNRQIDLKKLARACGVKKAAMADTASAERLTGYLVGGISPFNTRQSLPTVIDETVLRYDSVMINAGQRGIMVKMAPADIVAVLNSRVVDIADND